MQEINGQKVQTAEMKTSLHKLPWLLNQAEGPFNLLVDQFQAQRKRKKEVWVDIAIFFLFFIYFKSKLFCVTLLPIRKHDRVAAKISPSDIGWKKIQMSDFFHP